MNKTNKLTKMMKSSVLVATMLMAANLVNGQTVYTVTNTNNAGAGSLRQAILDANGSAAYDTIRFAIPGAGGHTISLTPTNNPADELLINRPVFIDGFSQGGSGYTGLPLIQVDCNNMSATTNIDGFQLGVNADGTRIQGLNIVRQYGAGIRIGANADNCIVEDCTFGVALDGVTRVASGFGTNGAVTAQAFKPIVRRCVLSGQETNGIIVFPAGDSAEVYDNFVGTDYTGSVAVNNRQSGIYFLHTVEGGIIRNNISSGNLQRGILLNGTATTGPIGTIITDNLIGVNAAGTSAIPNNEGILIVSGDSNTIGGTSASDRNIISGNTQHGVFILRGTENRVINNYIGTDVTGSSAIGNGENGIFVSSNTNGNSFNQTIGGVNANEGNLIANNGRHGVSIVNGSANAADSVAILGNRIFNNDSIGINLTSDDGVSLNDVGDGDGGENQLLNFPVITDAVLFGGDLDLDIDLDVPAGNYRIEVYANPSGADPTLYGEGEVYIGAFTVTHAGAGVQSFSTTFAGVSGVSVSDPISLTTTSCRNAGCTSFSSTSEFSMRYIVALPVNWVSFDVNKVSNEQVKLEWTTSQEDNNRMFEIMRKTSGQNSFSKVGEVSGAGMSNGLQSYEYFDNVAHLKGNVFYQLKQVDYNGHSSESEIRLVQLEEPTEKEVRLFPNPISANEPLNIEVINGSEKLSYSLVNTLGQAVLTGKLQAGKNIEATGLAEGTYFLRVYSQKELVYSSLLLVKN